VSDREMVEAFKRDGIKLVVTHRRRMPIADFIDEVQADMFYAGHADLVDRQQARLSRNLTPDARRENRQGDQNEREQDE
jgi:NADP-dependent 3-hydroxy acid dehydrogenase YdfG